MQICFKVCTALCLFSIIASVGCSRSEIALSLPVAQVTGSVNYKGNPLAQGNVVFLHESGQAVATELKTDGSFVVDAICGMNRITVTSRGPDIENPNSRPAIIPGKSLIPEFYADVRSSGLSMEVKPGSNHKTIELTDHPTRRKASNTPRQSLPR